MNLIIICIHLCLLSGIGYRQSEFLQIKSGCYIISIYLDTLHWAGGNTTLDAIACNLPSVTCLGEFMRGCHSYGFWRAIVKTETIADDALQYIQVTVRLGLDIDWRYSLRQALKLSSNLLFDILLLHNI